MVTFIIKNNGRVIRSILLLTIIRHCGQRLKVPKSNQTRQKLGYEPEKKKTKPYEMYIYIVFSLKVVLGPCSTEEQNTSRKWESY